MKKNPLIESWFANLIKESSFSTRWMSLSDSDDWSLKDGKIIHRSGRFFSIIGIRYRNEYGRYSDQPIIDQREIGTQGFLIKETDLSKEILVQAKIEPGNVRIIQLAPTCQATKSNLARIHGGKSPPFSHIFEDNKSNIMCSSLQSEQGFRFFGKRNRNIIITIRKDIRHPSSHRFIPTNVILDLLSVDYLINTDARSILVCSPWSKLVKRKPFTRFKDNFSKDLSKSFKQNIETESFIKMKRILSDLQKNKSKTQIISLEKLNGWSMNNHQIIPDSKKSFRVRYIKISAKNREVPQWDQPIIDSYRPEGQVDLLCGRINGVLHFNFKLAEEPGLYNNAELSPIVCIEPGKKIKVKNIQGSKVVKSLKQSEEGSRFYRDVTRYRLIDIGRANLNTTGYWLNLAQIQNLSLKTGWFTNEARSALSLLLYWL